MLRVETFSNSYLELNRTEARQVLYVLDSEVPTCFVRFSWGWVRKIRPHSWEPEPLEVRKPDRGQAALISIQLVAQLRDFIDDSDGTKTPTPQRV